MGKGIEYVTRGPEYEHTYLRSGTQNKPDKAVKCCLCGKFVSINDKVCSSCGFDLTSEEQLEQKRKENRSNRIVIMILITIGVIACAAAVYLLFHTPRIV